MTVSLKRATAPVAAGILAAAATAGVFWSTRPSQPSPIVTRFTVRLPDGQQFSNTSRQVMDIARDGAHIVYVANRQVYLRPMGELEPRPIQGIDAQTDPSNPALSPDGRWVAFHSTTDNTIRKVVLTGGKPITICSSPPVYGINWSEYGIIFSDGKRIMRVSENGGQPVELAAVSPGELVQGGQMLPGGSSLLYSIASEPATEESWNKARVVLHRFQSGERRTLINVGSDARYVSTGHVVYGVGAVVFAVPFDVNRLGTTGTPVPVIEGVRRGSTGVAHFRFSTTGALAFVPGPFSGAFDRGPDGGAPANPTIHVVLSWFEELRQRVPPG